MRYGLAHGYMRSSHVGSPIQISADRQVFAPPRSFSQLITSFFGSQCQGIRPVPFLLGLPHLHSVADGALFLSLVSDFLMSYRRFPFDNLCCVNFSRYSYEHSAFVFPTLTHSNGDGEIRTLDPLLARQVLSQLSYAPIG